MIISILCIHLFATLLKLANIWKSTNIQLNIYLFLIAARQYELEMGYTCSFPCACVVQLYNSELRFSW